jgi:hypothetical protein
MTTIVTAGILGGVALGAAPLASWLTELRGAVPVSAQASAPEALPLMRTPALLLSRARDLFAGGHLHDALRTLDRIDIGDPLHAEVERLRGEIQRDLLSVVDSDRPGPAAGAR